MYSIGEMSRRAHVKIPTIRYYEQMGLIEAPERSAGNQRRYTKSQLQRLAFIRHARDLGLAISRIRELIDLSADPYKSCREADQIATQHLAHVRDKIRQLKNLETELMRISSKCAGKNIGECYVIQSLSDHTLCESDHA